MKKKISLFLTTLLVMILAVSMLAVPASAATAAQGNCGEDGNNLTWIYDKPFLSFLGGKSTLSVSGSGRMASYTAGTAPWYSNASAYAVLTLNAGLTSIGDYAFYNLTKITSVSIPEGVLTIGEGAFKNCTALTSVTLPSTLTSIDATAFAGCTGLDGKTLASGTFASGVTWKVVYDNDTTSFSITVSGSGAMDDFNGAKAPGYYPFHTTNCTLTVASGITHIGDGAFADFEKVTGFSFPASLTEIGDGAFSGCTALASVSIPTTVKSIGDSAFAGCAALTSVNIPASATVGARAFSGCTALSSVSISNGVTAIGDHAFAGCTSLGSVTMPDSVLTLGDGAFSGCTGLKSATLGMGLSRIGFGTFEGCTALQTLTIPFVGESLSVMGNTHLGYIFGATTASGNAKAVPESLKQVNVTAQTQINAHAFSGCASLTRVSFSKPIDSVGLRAFAGCRSLTDFSFLASVTSIGYGAFEDCGILGALVLSDALTDVGNGAFYGCDGITSVTLPFVGEESVEGENSFFGYIFGAVKATEQSKVIPDGLTTVTVTNTSFLGEDAFYGCDGLTSVSLPDTVTTIGWWAFYNCAGLTSMDLPDSLVYLGWYAFSGCDSLAAVSFPDGLTRIGWGTFAGCDVLNNVNLPSSVTNIGYGAFYNCTALTVLSLPECLKTVEDYAFYRCEGLTSVYVPMSVTEIGDHAFEGATALSYVTLPKSLAVVGSNAFDGCTALSDVYYAGSRGDFAGISVESGNQPLLLATIHCEKIDGVLAVKSTDVHTAWGVETVVTVTAEQLNGMGGYFVLLYDVSVADLVSFKAADGVSVSRVENGLAVDVARAVEKGEVILTCSFTASAYLAAGEHELLSLDKDTLCTASFGTLRIFAAGDVNMDGIVNTRDAALIKQYVVKMKTLDAAQIVYADVNGDGTVSAKDAMRVQQYVVKMPVDLGRYALTFVNGAEQLHFTVAAGGDFTAVPEAPAGYIWSLTESGYTAPDYTDVNADTVFYLVAAN